MSMYAQFETDPVLESKTGVIVDYTSFRVTLARAGGANKRHNRVLEKAAKQHRREIQADTFTLEQNNSLQQKVYAETVILNWETLVDGKFKKGIEDRDGKLLPVTPENIIATFKALPELFGELQDQATKFGNYKKILQEADSKN